MNKILGNKTAIAAFVAPSLILFGGIIFYSIIMSFRYSLLDWNGFGEGIFVGFSNYAKMFQDKVFLRSAVNSLLLGFVTLVTQLPLALLLALLLTSGIKGEGFYRTVFFIPMTLSSVVIGQLWLKIYNPNYGVLNTLLGVLGLESLQRSWLGDVNTALFSAFVPIIWQNVGYHMLLLYTSINSISKDILEAAKLDGASGVKAARYITILPLFLLFRKMHIINNPLSILIPYIVFALPTGILILTNAYASLPIEMEESACIDGCNIYQLFWKIMFPLVKPTVAAIALFTFLSSWNELMFAMTFISEPKWKTLTIGLQSLSGMFYTEWGPIGAGMVVATAPVLIIYLLLNRQVQNALIMGAVKG